MVSQSEHRVWADLGQGLTNIFRDWGQQRARRAELDAQIAQAELERRDRQEVRKEQAEINRRLLEIQEEAAAEELKRYEADIERREELESLSGGLGLGKPDIPAAGRIAGQELGGRIKAAEGFLPQIRAAITGLAPALRKGYREAPREPYATAGEYTREAGLSREQAGMLMTALGAEAFAPKEMTMADFQLYAVLGPDNLPPYMQPYRDSIAREHEYMLEQRDPKYFEQATEAFNLGMMAYTSEGEMKIPEHMKDFEEFNIFFEGGKKNAQMSMRRPSGPGGPPPLTDEEKALADLMFKAKFNQPITPEEAAAAGIEDIEGFIAGVKEDPTYGLPTTGDGETPTDTDDEPPGDGETPTDTDDEPPELSISWNNYMLEVRNDYSAEAIADRRQKMEGSREVIIKDMLKEAGKDLKRAEKNDAPQWVLDEIQFIINGMNKTLRRIEAGEVEE